MLTRTTLTRLYSTSYEPSRAISLRLNWLLRHGASENQLLVRPDGYVRVDDVRSCWSFRNTPPEVVDEFLSHVARGNSKYFNIKQDYDIRTGAPSWWIRTIWGHTIPHVDVSVKRIHSAEELPLVVFPAGLDEGTHAEHHGIFPDDDGLICLRSLPPQQEHTFSYGPGAYHPVCIYLDVAKMLDAGIQLFRNSRGHVLTTGDHNNVIHPWFFAKVEHVRLRRERIWRRAWKTTKRRSADIEHDTS
ncbi:hypothetical protein HMN09_01356200 [Mycena chlorophos]|uniref:2'-phosphotransferase n=1 Tax=Mycena chlorophos TaxID=658473 RepID=A0A8H6RYT9_MYCCL|nr:hypothetical protein HMN09_01356200 [Mycena chlorophos]